MSNVPFLRQLRLRNFLSYQDEQIECRGLNVLIGANGSGKSNLLECLRILQATPDDLAAVIREGGGVDDWISRAPGGPGAASIEAILSADHTREEFRQRYQLDFTSVRGRLELTDETLENEQALPGHERPYFFYRYQGGDPVLNVRVANAEVVPRRLKRQSLKPDQSIFAQRRDPEQYPEVSRIAELFAEFRIYRELGIGPSAGYRYPQKLDLPSDQLEEDGSNLVLVLGTLQHFDAFRRIEHELSRFYEGAERLLITPEAGTLALYLKEAHLSRPTPATRLSDGTLRFLCLLTVLCHPDPPPVVAIEEPELGLHPDAVLQIADLIVEASQRTQLFITTHSEAFVSALSEQVDDVVVCEKINGLTRLRRLESEALRLWLERYSLGELWRKGELGGNPV